MEMQTSNMMASSLSSGAPQKKTIIVADILYRVLLAFLILVFLGIGAEFGYLFYLNKENARLDGEIIALNSKVDFAELAKLAFLSDSLSSLNSLFANRLYASNIFGWLEKLTLPSVQFSNFNFDASKLSLRIDVLAPSLNALALQAASLRQDEDVLSVDMSSASVLEKGVFSSFTINLNKKLFRK